MVVKLVTDPMKFPTPAAEFEGFIHFCLHVQAMGAFIWKDQPTGSKVVQAEAAKRGAVYLPCGHSWTSRQLLLAIAKAMRLNDRGTTYRVWWRVAEYAKTQAGMIFIDQADRLRVETLELVRDIYDDAHIVIILVAANPRLLVLVDDTAKGGTFSSRCVRGEEGVGGWIGTGDISGLTDPVPSALAALSEGIPVVRPGTEWFDNPQLLVGRRFEFVSGPFEVLRRKGKVVKIEDTTNAAGAPGKLVIHTFDGSANLYRTRWSAFRQQARLLPALTQME